MKGLGSPHNRVTELDNVGEKAGGKANPWNGRTGRLVSQMGGHSRMSNPAQGFYPMMAEGKNWDTEMARHPLLEGNHNRNSV